MHKSKTTSKTCFFGTRGQFSATALRTLLDHGAPITRVFCASVAPASLPETHLPVSNPTDEETVASLANRHGIPIQYITRQSELASLDLQKFEKPDFILIACFPYRLPELLICWPESGCLNIHPSLLPKYRGPDPIFWQLRNNESQTGVTLHFVTSELDAGPIVDQISCLFEEGSKRHDIEIVLARFGATLFTSFLGARNTQNSTGTQQNKSLSSYYPCPSADNYEISTTWRAKDAFNFIRGTRSPSGYYLVKSKSESLKIITALEYYDDNIHNKSLESEEELFIKFSAGFLRVKVFKIKNGG